VDSFPPVIIMLAGAVVVPFLPGTVRPWAFLVAPVAVLLQLLFWLEQGDTTTIEVFSGVLDLTPLMVDDLNEIWATAFSLVVIGGGLFALHLRAPSFQERGQQAAALAYAGSAFGVILAGDLLTVVIFWELMAVTSLYLIISGNRPNSHAAAMRYLFVHVIGGSALLGGVLIQAIETGSLAFEPFDGGLASWLAMFGILVNAASFPLHAWLSDAYPETSPTGMVFLGALTTKTAVYVLLRGFAGEELLLLAGSVTAVYAGIYALLQNDIRRLLAYHIVSQVGFMVAAVGISTLAGVESVAEQVFTHVLWQAVMVMGAGAVMYSTGVTKLTELGGLSTQLRPILILYMVGALSIAVFPLLHGLGAESVYVDHTWVIVLLTLASIATVMAVAIKLPYHAFIAAKANAPQSTRVPNAMLAAMAIGAALSLWVGIHPSSLFDVLQLHLEPEAFHLSGVLFGLAILAISAAGGWLLLRVKPLRENVTVDVDWLYRNAEASVRVVIQQPLDWVFTTAQRATSWIAFIASRFALTPPSTGANLVGRPPLGLAVAVVFLTFVVVVLLTHIV
jgi:multicomponent Na+:H+ antiporter subunit D